MKNIYPTYCEIDLSALRHNLKEIVRLAARNSFSLPTRPKADRVINPVATVLPVVKADAYGHGVKDVALTLDREGVGYFAVSDLAEGIALRKIAIKKPILLFESALAQDAPKILHYQLIPTIYSMELAEALDRHARKRGRRIDAHVKIDTGMGRLGVWHEDAFEFIQGLWRLPHLRIMGIFTHFPSADTDRRFTRVQIQALYRLVTRLDRAGLIIPFIHAANSMGLAGYQTRVLNLARPGLMLYGLYPHEALKKNIHLKPVMSVRSRVIFLKDVPKGRSISYGRTFLTKKDMRVATVPIGYSDGYFRALSNRGEVLIDGARCPVIGRVTMDQIMVDVSRAPQARVGSPVTVLGEQNGVSITADDLAKATGTISYEIVCNLGNRLPRVVV